MANDLKSSYENRGKEDTKKMSAFKHGDKMVGTDGNQFKSGNGGVRMSVLQKRVGHGMARAINQKGGK